MKIRTWGIAALTALLVISPLSSTKGVLVQAAGEAGKTQDLLEQLPAADQFSNRVLYAAYLQNFEGAKTPDTEIIIEAADYVSADGMVPVIKNDYEGMSGRSVLTDEEGEISWEFDVAESGLYNLSVEYYPVAGKSTDIQRTILLDGKLPFFEANYLKLPRVWGNRYDEIKVDNQGNDLRPQQIEKPMWRTLTMADTDGKYPDPYRIYLSAGRHQLTFVSQREPVMLKSLKWFQEATPSSYQEVLADWQAARAENTSGVMLEIQAEDATYKSSPTLYPLTDRSSSAISPYSAAVVKMNTIGGNNWRLPGQWITWEIEIPESGYYHIGMHTKQSFVRGTYSARKLKIDGVTPFQEVSEVKFKYKSNWRMEVLGEQEGEGEPYLFYLTKGRHEISLEVNLASMAPMINDVEQSLLNINALYRQILMITSSSPDNYRDYQLEKKIPDLIKKLQTERDRLDQVIDSLKQISNNTGSQEALLLTMRDQLDEMVDRPDKIPQQLTSLKTNAGGLGTWMLTAREQPLQLDALYIVSPDQKLPESNNSWLAKAKHEMATFFNSFFIDYNRIGDVSDENSDDRSITVWVGSGRDQSQTLKAMIDELFTPESGIQVNLELVPMHTLLQATLAGQGPDIAMGIGNDIPVNYAMRNAVKDLSKFDDFDEVAQRFRESAMVPYGYGEGVYALPEQQTFNMMFYRKDILEELNLEIPITWDDVYSMLSVLSKSHMQFGLPLTLQPQYAGQNIPPNPIYGSLLFQNNGQFYRNQGQESDLDSKTGIEVFKTWTEFYTDYKLDKEFDFANRFRTGEMPIGIADYTMYNQLSVFAPEINGLWEFVPIPGTVGEDGAIHRDTPASGTGLIMLKGIEDEEAGWEFMKWWTSEEIQTRFGREMEGLMGAAARYPTANINALEQLPWPIRDYQSLTEQLEDVRGIPEVPGGYFTGRHLVNAFYQAVNEDVPAREAIMDYVEYIQDEISLKRKEFGLSNSSGQ
ncbi:extracellular solute-binding protein [Paenibacillus antibioticophila]|nr:extracellular solute-binding protein [Paenibacillus antibioticophila]